MTEAPHSELLHDAHTGDWVIIAPKRAHRPIAKDKKAKVEDRFSIQNLKSEKILAVYGKGVNRIAVVENKYPVFQPEIEIRGHQEILVEGTAIGVFVDFPLRHMEQVFQAYVARAKAASVRPDLQSVVIFKNEGFEAGASQVHAHSQLYGLSFVPARWKDRATKISRHSRALKDATPERTIFEDASVIAFAHPSARFPYEVRVIPRREVDNITLLTKPEVRSLAKAVFLLLKLVKQRKLAFNFFFHDVFDDRHESFELHFVPRGVNVWGGFELDAGIAINPISAEMAAQSYRDAAKKK